MENLLRGDRRLLKYGRQSGPPNISNDGSRKIQSANIGKDQRVLEEWRSFFQRRSAAQIANQHGRVEVRQVL